MDLVFLLQKSRMTKSRSSVFVRVFLCRKKVFVVKTCETASGCSSHIRLPHWFLTFTNPLNTYVILKSCFEHQFVVQCMITGKK